MTALPVYVKRIDYSRETRLYDGFLDNNLVAPNKASYYDAEAELDQIVFELLSGVAMAPAPTCDTCGHVLIAHNGACVNCPAPLPLNEIPTASPARVLELLIDGQRALFANEWHRLAYWQQDRAAKDFAAYVGDVWSVAECRQRMSDLAARVAAEAEPMVAV